MPNVEDCKKVNCWAFRELKWGVLCIAKECIHPEAHLEPPTNSDTKRIEAEG